MVTSGELGVLGMAGRKRPEGLEEIEVAFIHGKQRILREDCHRGESVPMLQNSSEAQASMAMGLFQRLERIGAVGEMDWGRGNIKRIQVIKVTV
jgi:hypothetical protein